MGKTIRVLQVLGGTNLGGAESRVMDLYRNMDRDRIQFDFAVHGQQQGYFDEEIRKLGGRIYRLPRFVGANWTAYRKAWRVFFASHPGYACVHGHMTSTASIYLPEAKRAGVPLTIAHARSAGVDAGPKGWLTRQLRRSLWKRADVCLAASKEAGRALVCYVRYQSHLTGTFDCNGKFSLMTGAHTCHTAGKNFSAFREILFEFCNVLVIDGLCLFDAEVTNLSACRLSYRFFNFFVFHIGFLLV